jgi:hypothetical protein
MDVQTYDATHALADMLVEELQRLFDQGKLPELEARLKKAGKSLNDGCSLSLNFSVEVFDPAKDKALKTSDIGLAFIGDEDPQVLTFAPTPAKYVVDGVIRKVPHDHCPHCWSRWNFKSRFHECPACGYRMGREIKLLLDSDICPHCENSKISFANPHCEACGFVVDGDLVVWG